MLIKKLIIGIASFGLLFGGAIRTVARMSDQTHISETSQTFQRIEQPLWVKK